jgi:VanZ family protein
MVSAWLPALFGVLVIVLESTDWFSSEHTSGPLRHLWTMLFGPVADPAWRHIHTGIRKLGHMVGYGMLNALFFRAWFMTLRIVNEKMPRPWLACSLLAPLSTFLIGSLDELHQGTIPTRTSTPLDVAIDMVGALTVQFVLSIYFAKRTKMREFPAVSRS